MLNVGTRMKKMPRLKVTQYYRSRTRFSPGDWLGMPLVPIGLAKNAAKIEKRNEKTRLLEKKATMLNFHISSFIQVPELYRNETNECSDIRGKNLRWPQTLAVYTEHWQIYIERSFHTPMDQGRFRPRFWNPKKNMKTHEFNMKTLHMLLFHS